MPDPKVYIFWDNSNIFIEGQKLADDKDGPGERRSLRISFDSLYRLAHAARPIGGGVVAGSIPPEHEDMWKTFEAATPALKFKIQERGEISGKEQGVDDALHVSMLRALADNDQPQIAVLLTGDGKGYEVQEGFHADLERMHKKGWAIEVLAWDRSCKQALKKWATDVGVFVPLENFYESVTFINGGRVVKALSLTRRAKAAPKVHLSLSPKPGDQAARKQQDKERGQKKWLKKVRLASQTSAKRKAKK